MSAAPTVSALTREQWLAALVDALRPVFKSHGYPLPAKIRVSCGWPSRKAIGTRSCRIGEAWSPQCSADGTHETFLSPMLDDPIEVGHVLVHELVHHAVGVVHGHRGPFAKLARAIGLVGKLTATTAGPELEAELKLLIEVIGVYPHRKLVGTNHKKQSTRMLKVTCIECGCIVRMTQKWLDDVGCPTCACGGAMER